MPGRIERSLRYAVLILIPLLVAAGSAGADEKSLVAKDDHRVAIQGYDTVAYFTDGKAIKGSSEFAYVWDDATWLFATDLHRDMFAADPDRYMPQYGGFCAAVVRDGGLAPANPETWAIVDGKLYMTSDTPADLAEWQANAAENIKQADQQWPLTKARLAAQQP